VLPGELDDVAAQARDLREWFRAFVREHQGRPLTAAALSALDPLNLLLERDTKYARVVARAAGPDSPLELVPRRRWRSPESLLQPLGEALAALLVEEDFSQIKACEGTACTLLFVDHTRAHTRRWCSMQLCGNRAKQAAHRSRVQQQH
jgi:predicted RNA-binding Zn ribbon-like protein